MVISCSCICSFCRSEHLKFKKYLILFHNIWYNEKKKNTFLNNKCFIRVYADSVFTFVLVTDIILLDVASGYGTGEWYGLMTYRCLSWRLNALIVLLLKTVVHNAYDISSHISNRENYGYFTSYILFHYTEHLCSHRTSVIVASQSVYSRMLLNSMANQ